MKPTMPSITESPVQVVLPMNTGSTSPVSTFKPDIKPERKGSRHLTRAEERRAVLAEIDNAAFTKFHVQTVLTTAAGFFTDAYDVFSINLTAAMIGLVYTQTGQLSRAQELSLKIATPVGNLIGQLVFGWLADLKGRRKMYGVELIMMATACFGQALAGQGPGVSLFGVLFVWRIIMGIGIGGDYPVSAVISSEFSPIRLRGRMMSLVVAMQGFGNITASFVSLVAVVSFKSALLKSADHAPVDYLWRIVIGIGVIPSIIAVYSRLTIPESPRFTMDVERNLDQAASDADFIKDGKFDTIEDRPIVRLEHIPRASRRDFINYYSKWPNLKILLACSWSWFATDFVFYGLALNPSIVLKAIGYGPSTATNPEEQVYQTLYNTAVGNIVLSCAGLIPGYWLSFFLIDKWGRKPIQYLGFIMLSLLFIIMGFGYNHLVNHSPASFAFLYSLASLFQNFRPNVTTFLIPGKLFPTRYRSTSHGIAAATGKLGAILAQALLVYAKDIGGENHSVDHVLEVLALVMMTGLISTYALPETKGRSLESLSGEEEDDEGNFASVEGVERLLLTTYAVLGPILFIDINGSSKSNALSSIANIFRKRVPTVDERFEVLS